MSELKKFAALNPGDEFYVWNEEKNEPEIVRLKKLPSDTYLFVDGMVRKATAIRMCDAFHVFVEEKQKVVFLYSGWSRNGSSSVDAIKVVGPVSRGKKKEQPVIPPYGTA